MKKETLMYRLAESKFVCAMVCISCFLAVSVSWLTGGPLPAFGAGLLPERQSVQLSQSPFPPPNPDTPWLALAQSPFPPPNPDTPWLALA
ncbi:MAG: hypothetical protein IT159_00995 [Bryobacterales bacterium]|nr:hypothetical protein [Bryobacterales bacterium]